MAGMQTTMVITYGGLTIYKPILDDVLNNPQGGNNTVGKYMRDRGKVIMAAAKKQVGVKTGVLRASIVTIHTRAAQGQQLWIGSYSSIALLHHEGSRPHLIHARDGGMLRFSSGGRVIYTRMVRHPGTRPNHYLSDNLVLVRV